MKFDLEVSIANCFRFTWFSLHLLDFYICALTHVILPRFGSLLDKQPGLVPVSKPRWDALDLVLVAALVIEVRLFEVLRCGRLLS